MSKDDDQLGTITAFSQIMAQEIISFQQLFTPATKRDQHRTIQDQCLLVEVLNQSFLGIEF